MFFLCDRIDIGMEIIMPFDITITAELAGAQVSTIGLNLSGSLK